MRTAPGSLIFNISDERRRCFLLQNKKLITGDGIKRIVAVSDIHGWYIPLRELFIKGGIIEVAREEDADFNVDDDNFRYVGRETTIMILGDFVDVDNEGRKVMELITRIEKEAEDAGGELITLSGNHELDLLGRDDIYWGKIEYYIDWIRDKPYAAIINDILFIHAGISNSAIDKLYEFQKNGEELIKTFKRALEDDEEFRWEVVNRSFDLKDSETIERILKDLRVDYVVVGHVSILAKRRNEIKLVGPEIEGSQRIFNIDTEMGIWSSSAGIRKNGGMLSLSWKENGNLEIDYIF
ncbi:MAG: metallophosphoesterase [Halobacteriota archaeon]|nr:metallophosphoesterase [Halobacteriota archaeon]